MKLFALAQGFHTLLSNEEQSLVTKIDAHEIMLKRHLDEREREVARGLVNKGVLTRLSHNNKLAYQVCSANSIWRM